MTAPTSQQTWSHHLVGPAIGGAVRAKWENDT